MEANTADCDKDKKRVEISDVYQNWEKSRVNAKKIK